MQILSIAFINILLVFSMQIIYILSDLYLSISFLETFENCSHIILIYFQLFVNMCE